MSLLSATARAVLAPVTLCLLPGCAQWQPDGGAPYARAAASGTCHADAVQWAIGQAATQQTMARIWRESGAGLIRPIGPDQAVTRDRRDDRVDVEIDADNRIVRITCG